MVELKTKPNSSSVSDFIHSIENEVRRNDSLALLELFVKLTGEKPVMWGTGIIGFGSYHYKSQRSKQEGDWPLTGFSPRKQNLTVYIMPGFQDYAALLKNLGIYKKSVSCLYIKRLSDIHVSILSELIQQSVLDMKKKYSVTV